MWDFETYRALTADRLREAAREVARIRLAQAAEAGRRVRTRHWGRLGAGREAVWGAILRALRLRISRGTGRPAVEPARCYAPVAVARSHPSHADTDSQDCAPTP